MKANNLFTVECITRAKFPSRVKSVPVPIFRLSESFLTPKWMLACEILSRDISSYFHVIFFHFIFLFILLLFGPCSFLIQWIPRQFSEKSPTLSFDLFPAPIKIKCMAKFKCYKWERTFQYRYIHIFIRKMFEIHLCSLIFIAFRLFSMFVSIFAKRFSIDS